jgi:hypothetical protein
MTNARRSSLHKICPFSDARRIEGGAAGRGGGWMDENGSNGANGSSEANSVNLADEFSSEVSGKPRRKRVWSRT